MRRRYRIDGYEEIYWYDAGEVISIAGKREH
jgi:hypothetical protein